MGYGEQPLPPQHEQQMLVGQQQQDDYYYPGDMWQGHKSNDSALQVREAVYSVVEEQHKDDNVFETWVNSRRTLLTRASRIPGVDGQTFRRMARKFKYIVARAHSEGKDKIVRSMCENFDFELELLVSRGDIQMQGMTGVTAMVSQNVNQKQDIRMPQQQAAPSLLSSLTSLIPGRR